MVRRALNWKFWMSWMLASLAEPHNSTPHRFEYGIFILFLKESFNKPFINPEESEFPVEVDSFEAGMS